MSAEILALLDSDPAAGILAVADLREQRATCTSRSPWTWNGEQEVEAPDFAGVIRGVAECIYEHDAEHIAAEANPAHALAAVDRWRRVARRHTPANDGGNVWCEYDQTGWQCPDIEETVAEARAYLGGAQ